MKLSGTVYGNRSLAELKSDSFIDFGFIPCIDKVNFDLIYPRGKRVILHVACNRIEKERLLTDLQDRGIREIFLISGQPGYGKIRVGKVAEITEFLSEHGINVSVGAYPEGFFSVSSPEQRRTDIKILRDKVKRGAKGIVTQATFNGDIVSEWIKAVRDAGIEIPIQIGIMPKVELLHIVRFVRNKILHPGQGLNIVEIDWLYRLVRSTFTDHLKTIEQVLMSRSLIENDGFHLVQPIGKNIAEYSFQVRKIIGGNKLANTLKN